MARYRGPYAAPPKLTLDLRTAREGGALRARVLQSAPAARSSVVVLVHGFNNHAGEAGDAYWNFRQNQVEAGAPLEPKLEDILAGVFWPGDAAWGAFDLADFLVYPAAVATAQDAAERLAQHLISMAGVREVHFLGHSLGCRVVLETIDRILSIGRGPVIGKVALMAAAVPLFKLLSGARGKLRRALLHPRELLVLYSGHDTVLRFTFAPGQTVAGGDEGFFPTALGLHGMPAALRPGAEEASGAGHGDYWPGQRDASNAQRIVVGKLADFFRWSDKRMLGERGIPAVASFPSRAQPLPRAIA